MTTTPPPPAGPNYSMQRAGNGYAVASLILSIVGFCLWFVGGLIGIVLGIMGVQRSRATGTGRGLAIAGIIIGVISVLFSAGGTVVAVLTMHKAAVIVNKTVEAAMAPRATVANYLIDLSKNDLDAALGETSGMTKDDVAAHAAIIQPAGLYRDISTTSFNISDSSATVMNGTTVQAANKTATVVGTANFANGTKSYDAQLIYSEGKWKITKIKLE